MSPFRSINDETFQSLAGGSITIYGVRFMYRGDFIGSGTMPNDGGAFIKLANPEVIFSEIRFPMVAPDWAMDGTALSHDIQVRADEIESFGISE